MALKVILPGPFKLLEKVIEFVVDVSEADPEALTAPPIPIALDDVIELLRVDPVPPVCVKEPEATQGADRVNCPAFPIKIGPEAVVVTAPLNTMLAVVIEMPPRVLVLVVPPKVVVPEPPTWARDAAFMGPSVALAACVMLTMPSRVIPPI